MAVLPIVLDPDPILRRKAQPVRKINAALRRLLADMAETMYAAPGIGLAAPQVGVSKRVIVVDVGDDHRLIEMINPEITEHEGLESGPEGCLSIPGFVGEVDRYARIKVVGLDRQGNRCWVDAEGLLARCLQHEIDHLDGILYTDTARNVRPTQTEAEDEGAAADPAVIQGRVLGEGQVAPATGED